jgi:RNA-directed DNA polymerase
VKGAYETLFELGIIDQETLFSELVSPKALDSEFRAHFLKCPSKGVDRRNGFQLAPHAPAEFESVSIKCRNETFKFSPYLESLKSKGRAKSPRLISMPTIRDRVLLRQLNKFLAAIWPDRAPKNVAHSLVRQACARLKSATRGTWICKTDIQTFYDGIQHERLMTYLRMKVTYRPALTLVWRAIRAPTVEKNAKRGSRTYKTPVVGVPQGLAISNILASIYMLDLDTTMQAMPITYSRYVDDILVIGKQPQVRRAFGVLRSNLKGVGLAAHSLKSGKTQIQKFTDAFEYLGYVFRWPNLTVRDSTVERFLQSVAAMFSSYKHSKARKLAKLKYLTEERLKAIFMMELNEKIAGAISENRRYGWIAYFNLLTEESLLHRLDSSIRGMFSRLEDFNRKAPESLKRLARAYFEMKFNPRGGYVRNFDVISSTAERLNYLFERGLVAPDEALTDDQIELRFTSTRDRVLRHMHADEGALYGG